jgi:hypothetical protein
MADISKCVGKDCPIKEKCYRYTAPKSLIWQSYANFKYIEGEGCKDFWKIDKK